MFDRFNDHRRNRRCFLGIAAITLAFALFGVIGSAGAQAGQTAPADPRAVKVHPMPTTAIRLSVEGELPSLHEATAWLNSAPLTAAGLRGKVVLVEFWTYSCINWRRQLPYVRAWDEKYKDQGLVVIGVHAPEFSFEKNIDNVRQALKEMRIDYPIAIDKTMRSGATSTTNIGRLFISSMRRDGSDIINSARVNTNSRN
jgi:thiol-disulfide isomerase/thioredoxin